jgi:hypothetical protein
LKKDIGEINFPNSICAGHDFNKFSSHLGFEVHGLAFLFGQYISGRFVFKVTAAGLILILDEFWSVHYTALLEGLSRQKKVIRSAS